MVGGLPHNHAHLAARAYIVRAAFLQARVGVALFFLVIA